MPGVACESSAPAGGCGLFRFVHSFAFPGIKKKRGGEEIVDEASVTKISFLACCFWFKKRISPVVLFCFSASITLPKLLQVIS